MQNCLLQIVVVAILVGNMNAIFDAILVNYTGHVYCNVSTADGTNGTHNSNPKEGSLVVPMKNVTMTLMEWDGLYFNARGGSVGQ
jgi:archaellum component FlaF (FlaF/FlaG flagellin family)